jgi:hypothetical protein
MRTTRIGFSVCINVSPEIWVNVHATVPGLRSQPHVHVIIGSLVIGYWSLVLVVGYGQVQATSNKGR